MKLLHTEIDVEPGRKPQRQPLPEGWVGQGSAVVRLTNNTSQENAYTVRLRCDNPYFQDGWYTISALQPTGGAENTPPPGKRDQSGPHDRWVKVYITRGGTRDVMITLDVPKSYEARAGLYNLVVQVETEVVGQTTGLRRKERFTELEGIAIIRPFHAWTYDVSPEVRKVGFFKRGATYELVVTNEGNDWLYCDVRMPKSKDVLVELQSARLAVPPPEPAQERSVRTVPLKGVSRNRVFRGERQPQALPVTVARVDAPTVSPLPETALYEPTSANCHAAVVEDDPQDLRPLQNDGPILNCPLIPATLTGCMGAISQNIKGLIMTVIGLIVAVVLFLHMWEMTFKRDIQAYPSSGMAKRGECFKLLGKFLTGAQVFVRIEDTEEWTPLLTCDVKTASEAELANLPLKLLNSMNVNQVQRLGAKIPLDAKYEGKKVFFKVRRGGRLLFIGPMLPDKECESPVLVGKPAVKLEPQPDPEASMNPVAEPGKEFAITGENLGTSGKVQVGAEFFQTRRWTPTRIAVIAPPTVALDTPYTVKLKLARNKTVQVGAVTFKKPGTPGQPDGAPGAGGATGGPGQTGPGGPSDGGGSRPPVVVPPVVNRPPAAGGSTGAYRTVLDGGSPPDAVLNARQNDPLLLSLKGYVLLREERAGDARGPITQAMRLTAGQAGRARATALTAAAWLSEKEGDASSAERQYRSAITADRTCVLAYLSYTFFLLDGNRRMEAVEQMRTALRANPKDARGSAKFMGLAGKLGVR